MSHEPAPQPHSSQSQPLTSSSARICTTSVAEGRSLGSLSTHLHGGWHGILHAFLKRAHLSPCNAFCHAFFCFCSLCGPAVHFCHLLLLHVLCFCLILAWKLLVKSCHTSSSSHTQIASNRHTHTPGKQAAQARLLFSGPYWAETLGHPLHDVITGHPCIGLVSSDHAPPAVGQWLGGGHCSASGWCMNPIQITLTHAAPGAAVGWQLGGSWVAVDYQLTGRRVQPQQTAGAQQSINTIEVQCSHHDSQPIHIACKGGGAISVKQFWCLNSQHRGRRVTVRGMILGSQCHSTPICMHVILQSPKHVK